MATDTASQDGAATALTAPPAFVPPPPPQLNDPLTWWQKLVTLYEVSGLQRIRQETAANMKLLQKTQNGTVGQPDPAGVEDTMPGDISVGDQIHYHLPAAGGPTTGASSPAPAPAAGLFGTLAKYAGIAALAAGTGGLGALAAPAILNWLKPPVVTTPTTPITPDDPNYVAPGINIKLFRGPTGQ